MATLSKLVAKYGVAGTARIFQAKDHDVTEGRIRDALKVRRGRRETTARENKKRFEGYAKEVNLTKEYRKGAPSPEVVSAKVISSPVRTRTVTGRHGKYTSVSSGRYPHIDRANNVETWSLPRRPLHRESLSRLILEAQRQFDGRLVRVVFYGRFKINRGRYRLSARGGELGWREDRFSVNTAGRALEEALHEVNRQVTREMNMATTARERRWIEYGNPEDDENYPAPSARWASVLTGLPWSEVNWVMVEPIVPTVASHL